MKRITKLLIIAFASTALIACKENQKQQQNEQSATKTNTTNWSGTYEGVMMGGDTPDTKVYVLLALNSDGEYELFQKPLQYASTYASKGKLEWNASQDSVKLVSENKFQFQVSDKALKNEKFTLRKISNDEDLDDVYFSYLVKDDATGENHIIKVYEEGNVEYAEFEFGGKKYKLKVNMDDSQEQKYVEGSVYLVWNIIDPAPIPNYKPTFYDGKTSHKFTILSPSNAVYKAKGNAPVKEFDVLYFNHETGKSFAKLMSSDVVHSYILKQTEASAKTADYEGANAKWSLDNKNGAVFILDGKEYKYMESAF